MFVKVLSDLHCEFTPLTVKEDHSDVVILAGDIFTPWQKHGTARDSAIELFTSLSDFKDVIYVMGNHEHYHGRFEETADKIRQFLANELFTNVHFLDNEYVEVQGHRFIGSTMWTDMNKNDWATKHRCRQVMNDYDIIKKNTRRLLPDDTLTSHMESLVFVREAVAGSELPCVVVTHHGPTHKSIHPRYARDTLVNGAYVSDLSHVMLDTTNIKLWCHGHTHMSHDYMCGDTRVVCNPRGYTHAGIGDPENMEFSSGFIIEI